MLRLAPDTRFFHDLAELNREFLALICHPDADAACWQLLGLDSGIGEALRGLSTEELAFAAGVPGLLAEFNSLPNLSVVADRPLLPVAGGWFDAAQVLTAALLTYLWQLPRWNSLAGALCLGPGEERRRQLAAIRFRDIPGGSALAVGELRARFGRHPWLWPTLLRAARAQDRELRDLCRLDLISLGLDDDRSPTRRHRERSAMF